MQNQHNRQWPQVRPESITQAFTDSHPESKTPQQLLKTVPFNLVFRAEDGTDVKTDTLLSQSLPDKDTTLLSDLRAKGNL